MFKLTDLKLYQIPSLNGLDQNILNFSLSVYSLTKKAIFNISSENYLIF